MGIFIFSSTIIFLLSLFVIKQLLCYDNKGKEINHMQEDLGKKEIVIPQAIHSTFESYDELLSLFNCYTKNNFDTIIMNFRKNTWFDSNLLPIIYGYVVYGEVNHNIRSAYNNQNYCKLHQVLIRNGFAKYCFNMEYKPKKHETVVPFKVFLSSDTYGFGSYIDAEIVRYFPKMEDHVKKDLSTFIQELFGNAQIHGECNKVFTCGQYYYQNHKMDFTIVNLGTTIGENVKLFLTENNRTLPDNNISWAVQPENSTKRTNSGGMGLSLMQEFIYYNSGKYQIISGDEFWELNDKSISERKFKYAFPGTVINIEIDQNDKSYYKYKEEVSVENIF